VLLDSQGKRVWARKDIDVWHVEMLDIHGDGHQEILHSNARGQLLVRDGNGQVIARYLPNYNVSYFTLTRWGDESRPTHLLIPVSESRDGCCKPYLIVADRSGRTVADLELPSGNLLHTFNATPVQFAQAGRLFAVLGGNSPADRSILYLYRPDGGIAYEEILGESCLGIAALPRKNGDQLLVGCSGRVWSYSAASSIDATGNNHLSAAYLSP
jgi:hypothetical protein